MGAKVRFLGYAVVSNVVDYTIYPLLLLLFPNHIFLVIGAYAFFWLIADGATLWMYSRKRCDFFGLEKTKVQYKYSLLRSRRRSYEKQRYLRTVRSRYDRYTQYVLATDEVVRRYRLLIRFRLFCKKIFFYIKYEMPIFRNIFRILVLAGVYVKKITNRVRLLTVAAMSIEFNPFLATVLTKRSAEYALTIHDKGMFMLSFVIGQTYWALINLGIVKGITGIF